MPSCLKVSYVGNDSASISGVGRTVVQTSSGTYDKTSKVFAQAVILDTSGVDISSCQLVGLNGYEYQQLVSALGATGSAPGSGGTEVNVTADIFIACLLVLCFIGGWIAGGQR